MSNLSGWGYPMEKLTDEQLMYWHDNICSDCEKRKENKPKARCQIWYGLFVIKNKAALDNAHMFVDRMGVCKGYEPKVVR